jgi:hypothetical protein
MRVIHITRFLNTWRNLNSMGGHGWTHVMLWVGMGGHRYGYGLGMGTNSKENVGLLMSMLVISVEF